VRRYVLNEAVDLIGQYVTIGFLQAGESSDFVDGYVHEKIAPCTIIAQAIVGSYEVSSPEGCVKTERDEAFLSQDGVPLAILHRGEPKKGAFKARWLHARFQLFTGLDFVSMLQLPGKTNRRHGAQFGELIGDLLKLREAPQSQSLAPIAHKHELGFRALRLLCEASPLSATGLAFVQQADRLVPLLKFVQNNFAEPINIADMASAAHLSRSRFHAYFTSHMGLSPMDYVKQVRLTQAKLRLLTTSDSVASVGENAGFANPYHFSREFKRWSGLSPIEFRRRHNKLVV
jgi:AraC-like DNA-binding protein